MKNKILIKKYLVVVNLVILFAAFGFSVAKQEGYQKQQGFYLKLAPVDPRSLIQGDYMVLNYDISDRALKDIRKNNMTKGFINIEIDEKNIGQYGGISEKPKNKNSNKKISAFFTYNGSSVDININSFMFQEGDSEIYSNAEYAEVISAGKRLKLKKLADENFKSL